MERRTRNNRGWAIMLILLAVALQAQAQNLITLKLENKPLPSALKLIEREGGKNVIFSVTETEKHHVSADIRQKTQAEAIGIILKGLPFIYKERPDYFAIQKKDAQRKTVEIRGMVMNEKNEPMPYCNVLLLTSDSTFVNGCVTQNDGSFLMVGEEGIPYLLKASYIGYTTITQNIETKNLIQLLPDAQALEEVTVTANKPFIEPSANGLKANVIGTHLAKMGTAGEMLKHLPFVTSQNGGYSVLGLGTPLIYINNRKVRDMKELDRLRADEIVSAEVITTPGAEYASDVPAVIRIRTIKQRGQGWSGSLFANYTQGQKENGGVQVALNYRIGSLDIFGDGYLARGRFYGNGTDTKTMYTSSTWQTHDDIRYDQRSDYFFGTLGFNYDFNERHSIGMRYTPNKTLDNEYGDRTFTTAMKDGVVYDEIDVQKDIDNTGEWKHSVNGYYIGSIGKWQLDVNADYYFGKDETKQHVTNNGELAAESTSKARSYLYAIKAMASTPLPAGNLSFGTEETFTNRHDVFLQNGFSSDANNHIKQNIYSMFASYSASIRKWTFNAGIRYEHQQTDYYENDIHQQTQSPSYNDFIPTLSANYNGKEWNIKLAYRMSKEAPPYGILSNTVSYRSKYDYRTGDPTLKPRKTHSISANIAWKWIFLHPYFQYSENFYSTVMQPYNEETHPGVILTDFKAIPTTRTYGLSLNLSPKFGCWQPSLSANAHVVDYDYEAVGVMKSWDGWCFYVDLDNSFTLPNGWFINIYGYFQPNRYSGAANTKVTGGINARISKSFLKDNALTVTLTGNDILHTEHRRMTSYGIQTSTTFSEYYDNQRIGIQLSYKFNATRSKYKGTGAGQSEKSRL